MIRKCVLCKKNKNEKHGRVVTSSELRLPVELRIGNPGTAVFACNDCIKASGLQLPPEFSGISC